MRDFPQELVDLVLDNVAAGTADTKDIGICGAVCMRWLPRSRKHLFSHLTISNSGSPTPQSFLDVVNTSSAPVLSLVRTVHVRLALESPPITEHHLCRLLNFPALRELCIHGEQTVPSLEKLSFAQWVHTNIPRMTSACRLSLTRLELIVPTSFPLHVLADLLSGLSSLTELKIRSRGRTFRHGVVPPFPIHSPDGTLLPERTPRTDVFPPNLRTLNISLWYGTSFFFQWLLSHADPPLLTSLTIDAYGPESNPHDFIPLEAYLCRFGPQIHTLSLAYTLVEGVFNHWRLADTRTFHASILQHTPRLVHQMLFGLTTESIPATLISLPSPHLASLEVEVYLRAANPLMVAPPPDWAAIDAIVATSQFDSLRRLSFIDHIGKESIVTEEVRALMPRTNARGILVSPPLDEYYTWP